MPGAGRTLLLVGFALLLTRGGLGAATPLLQAHSHNDYAHTRPLLDALDQGFCSVEADIYLVEGKLLVAHSRDQIRTNRSLETLYLDPLRARVETNGGRVYPQGPEVSLLIDLKTDWRTTYPALRATLENYRSMLTTVEDGKVTRGAVLVVLSGSRAKEMFEGENLRLAAYDGELTDLDGKVPSALIPWVSANWPRNFKSGADGKLAPDDQARLRDIVARAKAQGRRVRFWGAPDKPAFWSLLRSEGVDLINTDKLAELAAFLRSVTNGRKAALPAHPTLAGEILYVVRSQYKPDHHNTATFFPSAEHEYNDGSFTPGGALKALEVASGRTRTILSAPLGVIRDPEVSFDGRSIVFSMRTNLADSYHIYEIGADGHDLRQLTSAREVDDLDPLYLADGSIAFSSTREPKYCMCNRHLMANLFRMEADGANIHQIGKSTLFEGHGALMPDGRILYDRWEYVDRNFGDAQALWTANPDGTAHAVYWGNNTAAPGAVIDARPIPGTDRVICVFGSCHDRPWGALAIIDRQLGLDGREPVVRTWPADAIDLVRQSGWELFDAFTRVPLKYEDPHPLDATTFLCSRMTGRGEQMGIYLIDTAGNELLVHAEEPGCFDPMPLAPRNRPAPSPVRREYTAAPGTFYVQDVYAGTHMRGVKRGTVKALRVVESPEKRFWTKGAWNGQGQEAPAMNWHDFNNKRILGTVPVEADGSAYFEVPPDRFLYFQLLDERGMMVQSMRSGVIAQPGERGGCIGCHEDRRQAPPGPLAPALALSRGPSKLQGWHGPPREFSYLAEVQPVFERHCLSCHDFGKEAAGKLLLAGDRDLVFNVSYNELWRKKLVRAVGAGPAETQAAYSWGSHASPLVKALLSDSGFKYGLTAEEFDRVVTWIDLNAPYYPSYASAYPENLAGRSALDDSHLRNLEQLTGVPLGQTMGHSNNRGPQVCFDRPELSPCLSRAGEISDTNRAAALEIIRMGQAALARKPEADSGGFEACALDQWREAKYATRRRAEATSRAAIASGRKAYEGGNP